jgi:hypothetical protein
VWKAGYKLIDARLPEERPLHVTLPREK